MASIFAKTNQVKPVAQAVATEKQARYHYVNIGIPVDIEGEEVFVTVPLAITADTIMEQVAREVNKLSAKSPSKFTEIQRGKEYLGTLVAKTFNEMEEGDSLKLSDLADNSEFGVLSKLQIQFVKVSQVKTLPADDGKATHSIIDKLKG